MDIDWPELVGTSISATSGYLAAFGCTEAAALVIAGRDGVVAAVSAVSPQPTDPYGLASAVCLALSDLLKAAGQSAAAALVMAGAMLLEYFFRWQLVGRLDADRIETTVDLTGGGR